MTELSQAAEAGLDRPTEKLIRAMYPSLRRFAAVSSSAGSEPDDLVQEALLRTLRAVRLSELEFPEAYVRRAILNVAMNERRSTERRRLRLLKFWAGRAQESVDSYPSDLADLSGLPAQSRAVLYMAEVDGATHAEIAATLEISESNSRMIASRARRVLRAQGDVT